LQPLLFCRNILIKDVPLSKTRGLPFFSWGNVSSHPFAIAVKNAIKTESSDAAIRSGLIYQTLETYYSLVTPIKYCDVSWVKKEKNFPPWSIIMPWEVTSFDKWVEHIKQSVIDENMNNGASAGIDSGWAWVGPVDVVKCEIETQRLNKTLESILLNGYIRNDECDGDIVADILVNCSGSWVLQTVAGQHRAAVLSGLDYLNVDMRVRSLVRQEDATLWPQVVSGFYTAAEALTIFDAVFVGKPPLIVEKWQDYVDKLLKA